MQRGARLQGDECGQSDGQICVCVCVRERERLKKVK